ncbi:MULTISPECIES: hypothetical protein [Actinotignum]|nr:MULTISPECIES: hypothetical protein [Actinotignum]MDK7271901.1 hypothetical protein [Actinotignum schaalii]MDY5156472.1 hypothetical protein [Actinotignum timonense]
MTKEFTESNKLDGTTAPDDAELAKVSAALIRKNARAYEELAK